MPSVGQKNLVLSLIATTSSGSTQPQEEQTGDLLERVNQVSAILKGHSELRKDRDVKERVLLLLENRQHPSIKTVETTLRNLGIFDRELNHNFEIVVEGEVNHAHKSILELEVPYFSATGSYKESQLNRLEMKETEFSKEAVRKALEYLYLPDEERAKFIPTLDKQLLVEMAELANLWQIEGLKGQCDEELCNSIGQLGIDKEDVGDWLDHAQFLPKFAKLLGFIKRIAGEGDLGSVIDQMETVEGASQLASKCTPEEIAAFATLKTEFGKACQMPEGAFGKAEWEKAFPVTIQEVPPLPANIHAILEQEDPCEPGKKLKETCMLFLRPEKVIFHEEEGDKELLLSFDGVEELAQKATNPERRTHYRNVLNPIREQMNRMPVAESGWVLMRKEVVPGTRNRSFADQQGLFKGSFEVPKLMDAILLNILTYASEGRYLYGQDPLTYTRCQEKYDNYQTLVGGFGLSGLYVLNVRIDGDYFGLSGAWKF